MATPSADEIVIPRSRGTTMETLLTLAAAGGAAYAIVKIIQLEDRIGKLETNTTPIFVPQSCNIQREPRDENMRREPHDENMRREPPPTHRRDTREDAYDESGSEDEDLSSIDSDEGVPPSHSTPAVEEIPPPAPRPQSPPPSASVSAPGAERPARHRKARKSD